MGHRLHPDVTSCWEVAVRAFQEQSHLVEYDLEIHENTFESFRLVRDLGQVLYRINREVFMILLERRVIMRTFFRGILLIFQVFGVSLFHFTNSLTVWARVAGSSSFKEILWVSFKV